MVIKRGSFISMVFSSYLGKVMFQETLAFNIYILKNKKKKKKKKKKVFVLIFFRPFFS
jgi:hypothetical protein